MKKEPKKEVIYIRATEKEKVAIQNMAYEHAMTMSEFILTVMEEVYNYGIKFTQADGGVDNSV